MLTQLSNHRSRIKGWESMKTLIWGKHRWDFYKMANNKNESAVEVLTPYFTKNNGAIPKKQQEEIKEYSNIIKKMTWFPLDRLYINAVYENSITEEKIRIDLSKKDAREIFLEKSKITPAEFFRWVLYVMDWENLKTLDDILNNFFPLQTKFQSFISSDTDPDGFKEMFNSNVASIDEHNIELIVDLNEKTYYEFITNPNVVKCSTKNALRKLFFLINNSDFLKGIGPFQTWKPSFENYTKKIDEIFSGRYSKNHKEANIFRRLKEHELRLYDSDSCKSYIDTTNFIPDYIKSTYAFKGWDVDIIKPEVITTSEMDRYTKMTRTTSDKIRDMADLLKKKYSIKNVRIKDVEAFRKQTIEMNKQPRKLKPKKIHQQNKREILNWKEILDRQKKGTLE